MLFKTKEMKNMVLKNIEKIEISVLCLQNKGVRNKYYNWKFYFNE
ncbi:hypothetical protein SAMN05421786_102343 [Chryseobacterium ureilyticum]|uniref:Uncharacterized protein n=1 Tax=Chryseobacterium ureilyticum TaxID=373668 RepID=A0A1N7M7S8_9FLAO|nr:hypothetical protein SAMN05421786_102343 [Chryseobacterium ureilyticum]